MDEIKAKISLSFLIEIASIIKPHSKEITLSTSNDLLFLIRDNNTHYDFYFKVEKEELDKTNAIGITFECKPFSELHPMAKGTKLNLDNFKQHLDVWFKNIGKYKSEKLIDDPIERQYTKEFYEDFKIIDPDADENGFNFQQQLLLSNYIEKIKLLISEETIDLSTNDKSFLISEADQLKHSLATETKNTYIKKLSNLWAKVRKKSIKTCETLFKEFAKEFIKEIAKKGVDINWNQLPQYIEHLKQIMN